MTQFPNIQSLSSHVASPYTPQRTLLDAEREIAELRLAMIGMGKTMGNWLDTLEEMRGTAEDRREEVAREGLRRLQRTLIDGATKTTSDLKEWAWSQELLTTPSVSSNASSADPLESSDNVLLSTVKSHATSDAEQSTPDRQSEELHRITLPANTFVLQSPNEKDSAGRTPTLRSSGALTSHFASTGQEPTALAQEMTADLSKRFDVTESGHAQNRSGETTGAIHQTQDQSPSSDQTASLPSIQSVPQGVETPAISATAAEVELDPLSGLAVNHEPRTSAFGMKRLSRDPPLRGLGFM